MRATTVVQAAHEWFFDDYGTCIVYAIVRFSLLIAFPHATCYIIAYVVTLGNVSRVHGEKNQDHPVLTRLVAAIFLVLYTSYNLGVYGLLNVSLNVGHAFFASPYWDSLRPTFATTVMLEPVTLALPPG
ncbi:chitin synthase [Plasmodiophora brassicae]